MNAAAMVDHVKRLDRLYLAAVDAHDAWLDNASAGNWQRFTTARAAYLDACIGGQRRFGLGPGLNVDDVMWSTMGVLA